MIILTLLVVDGLIEFEVPTVRGENVATLIEGTKHHHREVSIKALNILIRKCVKPSQVGGTIADNHFLAAVGDKLVDRFTIDLLWSRLHGNRLKVIILR